MFWRYPRFLTMPSTTSHIHHISWLYACLPCPEDIHASSPCPQQLHASTTFPDSTRAHHALKISTHPNYVPNNFQTLHHALMKSTHLRHALDNNISHPLILAMPSTIVLILVINTILTIKPTPFSPTHHLICVNDPNLIRTYHYHRITPQEEESVYSNFVNIYGNFINVYTIRIIVILSIFHINLHDYGQG